MLREARIVRISLTARIRFEIRRKISISNFVWYCLQLHYKYIALKWSGLMFKWASSQNFVQSVESESCRLQGFMRLYFTLYNVNFDGFDVLKCMLRSNVMTMDVWSSRYNFFQLCFITIALFDILYRGFNVWLTQWKLMF